MLTLLISSIDNQEQKDKFETIYLQYRKLLKYVAFQMLQDDFLAEDAVQEAFLKLTNYMDKVEDTDSHSTYSFLLIIIRSVCLDMLSKEDRQKQKENAVKQSSQLLTDTYKQTDIEVQEAIASLPEIYRDIMMLKFYYDMPDGKIANIMNIKASTVRKRLERARKMLTGGI